MLGGLHMVINVYERLLPIGIFVTHRRQRPHGGAVDRLEGASARALELLEGTVIEIDEQCADGRVELLEREELTVA